MNVDNFKPSYVWPNPAFPFRIYFDDTRCRIFIIENIQHNWNWLEKYHKKFKPTDVFLVWSGWYFSNAFAKEANTIFELLGLNKRNFFFLYNSEKEECNFKKIGFSGSVINQNAWLDESLVMKPSYVQKKYNAIYVARRSAFKRHYLAEKVSGLALVAGINHGNMVTEVPAHDYINHVQLTPEEVCEKINESHCGLILSETEGACFSSSEYLLCGIPVVSTESFGGRDVWYNDYNSIICAPDSDVIAEAVSEFVQNPRNPVKIRKYHIDKSKYYRMKFINKLGEIFHQFNINDVDPEIYFNNNFFHKMRKSYNPNFDEIFR